MRAALVEAARAARTKETYLSGHYHRIAARRGANRAAVALGHKILVIELGANYYDSSQKEAAKRRAIKLLESLGLKVKVEEAV